METKARLTGNYNSRASLYVETEQDIIDKLKAENEEYADQLQQMKEINDQSAEQTHKLEEVITGLRQKVQELESQGTAECSVLRSKLQQAEDKSQ